MPTLLAEFTSLVAVFSSLFSKRVWRRVPVLLAGAILAAGRRTVAALLRVMGLDQERQFQAFVPSGPIVLGMDDTIDRQSVIVFRILLQAQNGQN